MFLVESINMIDSLDRFYNINYLFILSLKVSWMCYWVLLVNVLLSISLRILLVNVLFRILECVCVIVIFFFFLHVCIIGFFVGDHRSISVPLIM